MNIKKEWFLYNNIMIYFKDSFKWDIDVQKAILKIEDLIPQHLVYGIDEILIGDFSFLKEKQLESTFESGAIFISNTIDSTNAFVDILIDEIAHAIDINFQQQIYSDGLVEKEFLGKRVKLYNCLINKLQDDISIRDFINSEPSINLTTFLYTTIDHKSLEKITEDIFLSPLAANSIKDYFTYGFKKYFQNILYKLSFDVYTSINPLLYQKIVLLILGSKLPKKRKQKI